MVAARPEDDIVVAKSELHMLQQICGQETPMATPTGIVDFLHLDALVQQRLVESTAAGYACTELGYTVAGMQPSETYTAALLYRAADIASILWKRRK
ncbi:hypothetical protein [Planctomyces sp. SH-PL14]|uniref:hypothetical protein n=1 Tax=Planctomyces sp. SH-PL14 TaxID=1632864 RepID=UPI00078ECDB8|nr:hypothetical protein [Planctomyces sp. SH-PL14]AMV17386.1 hypothetical protein VT03_05810 [Planctomyces sp. SH-PL14]